MTGDRPAAAPDEATLIAFADGELGAIERKRIERALAADPALAARIAAHERLRQRLGAAFAPVEREPVPDRLTALLAGNVVAFERPAVRRPAWPIAAALAASLVLGIGVGTQLHPGGAAPIVADRGGLVAAGALAKGLDNRLAATEGEPRILVSFRSSDGYCRVFAAAAADGIACRDGTRWRLRATRAPAAAAGGDYRQAGSADADLMAAAQAMMVGAPLDAAGEARARAAGWRVDGR